MSLATQIAADFLEIAADMGSESLVHTRTGPNTTATIDTAIVQLTERSFGEPAVIGYVIDSLSARFLVSGLAASPKEGDLLTRAGVVYEITKIKKVSRDVAWLATAERAYINTDSSVTVTLERATLGVDVAGSPTETWSTVTTMNAIEMQEDDVADMIDRLGVAGDKQAVTYFVPQSAAILPMDRLVVNGRAYRITMIGDQGRIARLQKIRVELYA